MAKDLKCQYSGLNGWLSFINIHAVVWLATERRNCDSLKCKQIKTNTRKLRKKNKKTNCDAVQRAGIKCCFIARGHRLHPRVSQRVYERQDSDSSQKTQHMHQPILLPLCPMEMIEKLLVFLMNLLTMLSRKESSTTESPRNQEESKYDHMNKENRVRINTLQNYSAPWNYKI